MAFAAAPAMAADVGGLNVAGYVDTILAFSDADEAITGDPDADSILEFSAAAQLEIGYQIGDAVSANIELYWTEHPDQNFDPDGTPASGDEFTIDGGTGVDLQQAYVSWAINEQVSLVMGKFHNWIGWEGQDAPELYRVNNSYMYAGGYQGSGMWLGANPWGDDVTGLGVIITPTEELEIGVFAVNYIYNDDNGLAGDQARTTDTLSFGAYGTYTMAGVGYFDLDISMGVDESQNADGDSGSILGIDLNGEIDALREDNGLLFAYDLNYTDYDAAASLGILVLANYALPTETPMSITGSINWYDPNDDDDIREDDDGLEIAIALLANPTDDENFSTNVELQYISRSADDSNEFGIFVEALAVIP
jgi:hypothetical protein